VQTLIDNAVNSIGNLVMSDPAVVVFSSLLLPPSQTFILAQGEMLARFQAHYVGSRRVPGLDLPPERTWVVNRGGALGNLREAWFKLSGFDRPLQQHLQQLSPALIHAQFGLSGALALPLARSLKIPLIVHFRGADATIKEEIARYSSLNHWIYFRRRDRLQRETQLFLTVSKFIKEKLIEQGFPPEKIVAHYHGVDTAQFNPDPDLPREPVVLFVGRLTEKKGCDDLIQAMAKVQQDIPEVELVLIGDGPLRATLETQARQSLKKYRFLGVQPHSVVKDWMNRSRLLATPSITASEGDSEGLPNVVLEAQAMGLPVIATLHAGIPEAVIDHETGLLAAERDPDALAAYALRLLRDPDLWQRFSTKGRQHVCANFDRATQTRVLEAMYESVLDEVRTHPL
jgi:colanic acid/amylovoran biosynthesis glycosyltransferase